MERTACFDCERMLGLILDAGKALIECGGETHRVDDTLNRLAVYYGFTDLNIWVIPTNIQATVTGPDGTVCTQVRRILSSGVDFAQLCRLNAFSRWACAEQPDEADFAARLREILAQRPQKPWLMTLGAALGGWGFGLFFGCDLVDSLIALAASVMISFLMRRLSVREHNPLILNFLISFAVECLIIGAMKLGAANHMGYITVGVVMLLVSGLGTTNGLRDLIHLDTLSGLINLAASFTGAIGIALGIAFPLMMFSAGANNEVTGLNSEVLVQIAASGAACVGFCLWFHVTDRKIVLCALGGAMTWAIYSLTARYVPGVFGPTMIASVACGVYGQILARVMRTPATIFTTVCSLPLIPGGSLYYAMYGLVTKDISLAASKGEALGLTCFGIVLGYMVVEVLNRAIGSSFRCVRRQAK